MTKHILFEIASNPGDFDISGVNCSSIWDTTLPTDVPDF